VRMLWAMVVVRTVNADLLCCACVGTNLLFLLKFNVRVACITVKGTLLQCETTFWLLLFMR
jgi:hypothetical protein